MKLIKAIPLYRNKFREPAFFFSPCDFSVGSIILTPLTKTGRPALIIAIDDLDKNKSFVRRNKIKVTKINSDFEAKFFGPETIKFIKLVSEKKKLPVNNILQIIISTKILKELSGLKQKSDLKNINEFVSEVDNDYIKRKILSTNKPEAENNRKNTDIETIGSILNSARKKKSSIHSEKHYLVDEIRNYFGEKNKSGVGSFSFYLGFFKKIPEKKIYQLWSEAKQTKKPVRDQQKIFWWKIGQYLKENKKG
ncbi:hypothetical protein A3I18_01095 [Candidatus Campbellbacteria bacterium RIFCSPLOWO2_02_FULL_35_11]|uniref:Uncharacterized protein n=1 Tax=Candidatus Campbellbacteria bacterium RIFCSPLOWO2_02_FULL_35_11 TaxID=1797581 RepID=A0A1F5ESI9_9BACT|nr:MAG: hypothetical protein A3I18_01095 [Candidatus Campbellbacteria bacterium RIFCSPLOWO2_02_FULL_35_11]